MRALAGILLLVLAACGAGKAPVAPVACTDPVRGCDGALAGAAVKVSFSGTPQPMRPFEVRVEGQYVQEIEAELSMPGMDMGPGRYRFLRGTDGILRAQITLPVCVAGRSDWIMILRSGGAELAIPFQAGR